MAFHEELPRFGLSEKPEGLRGPRHSAPPPSGLRVLQTLHGLMRSLGMDSSSGRSLCLSSLTCVLGIILILNPHAASGGELG